MQIPQMSFVEWLNVGLMATGGVVMLAVASILTARRRWRAALSFTPRRSGELDLLYLTLAIVLFLVLMIGMKVLGSALAPPGKMSQEHWIGTPSMPGLWPILANNVSKLILVGVVCVMAAIALDGGLTSFGWRHDRIFRDLVWAVLGYLVIWPVCEGLAYLAVLLYDPPPLHGVLNMVHTGSLPTWGMIALWLSAVLISPVAEEVFFRGMLQTVIRRYVDLPWLAIAFAAIAFGAMHTAQPQYVVPLTVLGLALGYVYERTGSLIAPVVIHVLFNSRTMIMDLLLRLG